MIPIYIPEHLQAQYEAQLAAFGGEEFEEPYYENAEPENIPFSYAEQSAMAASELYGADVTQALVDNRPSTDNNPREVRNNTKRKRDWDDKVECGEDVKGGRALPVAESLPEDGIPTNGEEYLLSVRIGAALLPEITRAKNVFNETTPPSDSRCPGYGVTTHSSEKAKSPIRRHPHLPSDEWILTFCAKFDVFRETIRSADFRLSPEALEAAQSIRLPGPKDAPAWRRFIYQPRPRVQKVAASGASLDVIVKQQPVDSGCINPVTPREGTDIFNSNIEVDSDDEQTTKKHSNSDSRDNNIVHDVNVEMTQIDGEDEVMVHEPAGECSTEQQPSAVLENVGNNCIQLEEECVPNLAFMRRLGRNYYFHLIAHFYRWLSRSLDDEADEPSSPGKDTESISLTALSENDSKWLFSLLAYADNELVDGKDIGILRDLARVCIELIRRSLNAEASLGSPSSSNFRAASQGLESGSPNNNWGSPDPFRDRETGRTSCWMVVAAIVSVWRQSDLWLEASARLHGDFHYSEAVDTVGYTL